MEYLAGKYDVIVVGAGHAGCEAALAAARLGLKTIVFSINLDSIANMPCNPSIGGTGKGHLVREIDALGGEMGKATDSTSIQSKVLNSSKGPAVFSLRAQVDRRKYQLVMKKTLEQQENLSIRQLEIIEIIVDKCTSEVLGVKTNTNAIYWAKAVVLTTGTYLDSKIIIGDVSYKSGPDGLLSSYRLSETLNKLGIKLRRFKTGTPARLNARTIDFSKMCEQPGDYKISAFSFENYEIKRQQVMCWLTHTTEETKRIITENLHRSPLFGGQIEGIGPRYCPSIEDKIVRFSDKPTHQVFLEPMGTDTEEMYLQGMSSSLPEDVQVKMIKSVPGLENASIMRSAYAIEYDCIDPMQLSLSLEMKAIKGLFCAGQINGSSGYEEAAAQGLIAGINAAMFCCKKPPLILDRSQAYIGVLIDDLVTKGPAEPYRIMTSRAEYRLTLRQDNADKRLTPIGYEIGLISHHRYNALLDKIQKIEKGIEKIQKIVACPTKEANDFLANKNSSIIKSGVKLIELLKRPEIKYKDLMGFTTEELCVDDVVAEQIEISVKYEGYIKKQAFQIEQFKKMEHRKLSKEIQYKNIKGIRTEAGEKLDKVKPDSVGQASRIAGVSPADISVLLIYLQQISRG